MPIVEMNIEKSTIRDTYVESKYPTSNFHTITTMPFGVAETVSTEAQSMVKFDLGLIPNNAVVNSAILRIANANTTAANVSLHEITSLWDSKAVTWDNKPTYKPTPEVVFAKTSTMNERNFLDVKDVVQEWLNGKDNNGLLIKGEDGVTYTALPSFHSTEFSGLSSNVLRPILTVDYSIPIEDREQVEVVTANSTVPVPSTKITNILPTGIKKGDLIVTAVAYSSGVIQTPIGWELLVDYGMGGSERYAVMYSFSEGLDIPIYLNFTLTPTNVLISNTVFRNVVKFHKITDVVKRYTSKPMPLDAITGLPKGALLLTSLYAANTINFTQPLNFSEYQYATGAVRSLGLGGTYNHEKTDYLSSELTFSYTGSSNYVTCLIPFALEPVTNGAPKIDGEDCKLGEYDSPLKKQYSVTDTEGDAVVITEKVNGVTLATKNVVGTHAVDLMSVWKDLPLGKHTVTVSASDDYDPTRITVRTWTFLKTLPADAKTPEVVSGVGDLVPIFETLKTSLVDRVGGNPLDTIEDIIKIVTSKDSGEALASSTPISFPYANDTGTPPSMYYIVVSALNFKPKIIIASWDYSATVSALSITHPSPKTGRTITTCLLINYSQTTSGRIDTTKGDESPAIIEDGQFLVPVGLHNPLGNPIKWTALS